MQKRKILHAEMRRLTKQNEAVDDALVQEKVPQLLNLISKCVGAQLDSVGTMTEGFQKVMQQMVVLSFNFHIKTVDSQ